MKLTKKAEILGITRFPEYFERRLLELAVGGSRRPRLNSLCPAERKLAGRLHAYTTAGRPEYRQTFDREVRRRAPAWFHETKDARRTALLAWARAGKRRPRSRASDPAERAVGLAFVYLTSKSSSRFEPDTLSELRRVRPEWFESRKDAAWDAIFARAKAGMPRPSRTARDAAERRLAGVINNAPIPRIGSREDARRLTQLKRLRPDWWGAREAGLEGKKREIVARAARGERRPSRASADGQERALAAVLSNLVSRPAGHEAWLERLKATAPEWFRGRRGG